ncbi:hypothetical protein TREAZ_0727 [Leadbettera azotonutricia ZAS-9]|uniref:Uncharacterized protein n=1 Tax=Leadbettera azotonutricia (strain ATCC BAA-888 / DSM 13862 / ZAS-9) TaxID=545695 RepID=F5YAA3_LEAAZ|nr:hypothetical protein TREAZ_0727 [Leadbettera azotonutricia ZAS-9]
MYVSILYMASGCVALRFLLRFFVNLEKIVIPGGKFRACGGVGDYKNSITQRTQRKAEFIR